MRFDGRLTLDDSIFGENVADSKGGAVYNAGVLTATLGNSVFSDDAAESGGAIYNDGTATLDNITLYANSASDSGGRYLQQRQAYLNQLRAHRKQCPLGVAGFSRRMM